MTHDDMVVVRVDVRVDVVASLVPDRKTCKLIISHNSISLNSVRKIVRQFYGRKAWEPENTS